MPALSPTMTHGAVAEWKVKEGQTIAAGDVLADIETDKATMALESMEDGVVARILVDSGVSAVKVGTVLGVMVEDAADAPAFATYEAPAPEATTELAPSRGELSTNPSADASNRPARTEEAADLARVWPSVRRLLAESGLDGSAISPTGPKRTLTKGDVLAAMGLCAPPTKAASSSSADRSARDDAPGSSVREPTTTTESKGAPIATTDATYETNGHDDVPVTPTRRAIASRLLESKSSAPHHYVSADVGLAGAAALRERLGGDAAKKSETDDGGEKKRKPSVNDCVLYAVSRALRRCPEVNAVWNARAGRAERLARVDVAVAVSTPGGLITPVVRDADAKSLAQIGDEVKALALRAREGKLKPEEYAGGSFTVSNLGMFPVDAFSAILNPPQGAIMAVGRGFDALRVDADDATKVIAAPTVNATVSADARAVDAAHVARFLEAFKSVLENPEGGEGEEKWAL